MMTRRELTVQIEPRHVRPRVPRAPISSCPWEANCELASAASSKLPLEVRLMTADGSKWKRLASGEAKTSSPGCSLKSSKALA